ncbi:MAG: phosphate acyltransferase PlsX [Dehalococcoidia bacterium]|jgi:glycerol-3-phosphate acyltransferase PlsX|nr:phosphate acyltransferase PlsX [Dehalococcoidia bacterium]
MSQSSAQVRVAVDAMGGDFAPGEIVKGAVMAARQGDVAVTLVGQQDAMAAALRNEGAPPDLLECVHAPDVIREGEAPALAIRHKKLSSIVVGTKLVKDGKADAFVSAGSSGAVAAAAATYLGMLEGMERPTIGGGFSSFAPNIVIMDLGANVDSKAHQLLSFAIAGTVYSRTVYGIARPSVGLLSTGSEEGKGNEAVKEAYGLLKKSGLNFIGNIEGSDILTGKANVVVCDGFVGNVLLKFYEGIGDHARVWLLGKYPAVKGLVGWAFDRVLPIKKLSYEGEEEGSGLLWGVNGVVRIAHGACKAEHIVHGINAARKAVQVDIVGNLRRELELYKAQGIL